MTATELKKRAIALAEKTKIDSVTPEEVGQLSNDIVEYIENVEINGSSLGIRKTYTSVSAMEADSTAPKDDKGVLLRRGMLVNIYNQSDPDSADNGKVFSFQNPGWAFRGTVDAGYATKEELTELDSVTLFKRSQKLNENAIKVASLVQKIFIINRDESKTYKLKSIQFNTEYSGQGNFFGQIDILNGSEIEKSIYFTKIPFSWNKRIIEVYTDIFVLLDYSSTLWGSETILLPIDMELSDMSSIEEMLFREWITAQTKTQEELTTSKERIGESIQENKENIIKCSANIIFVKTKGNLVNPKAVKKGYYIDNNGKIKEADDVRWSVSNYILCNRQNITSNGDTTFNTYNVYNEKGVFIRTEKGSTYKYVDGDYAVIISFYNKDNQWMANYGDILLEYEAYSDIFNDVNSLNSSINSLNNEINEVNKNLDDVGNDIYEATYTNEVKESITLEYFSQIGILKTDGKLYDESENENYKDYRVLPYMDISQIDKMTFSELTPVSGYASIALYSADNEDSLVAYISSRSGEIILSEYPNAKFFRASTYYSLHATISLIKIIENKESLPKKNKEKLDAFEKRIYGTKILIVDKNGNGDFTNLDDALDNANDSKESPTTILIMPGTYEMKEWNNDYTGKKNKRNLNIIGTNPYQCILTNNKGAYNYNTGDKYVDNACLKIAGNCLIKNLSIISTSENYDEYLHGTDWKRSYCIHCDAEASDGDVLWIDNCIMYNDHFSCIGAGHRTGYKIKITNCEFKYESAYPTWDFAAAVYIHDNPDKERQEIELLHNIIRTTNSNGIYIDCGIGNTQIDCTFVGNVISVPSDKKKYSYRGNPILNNLSYNNNSEDMNYTL